ncbi:olfactory receptor 7G2-like [Manis pentadactyla]|uniref:olfactory receptor 7G2-like n=1 Tax=Manis pentadactyla TaxID=143292 RepID=UPI00255CA58F|nr:olfactory receptor 7G2-like [Manis pentadactyla]
MELKNHTEVPDFLLLGLKEDPELQPFIYSLLLSMCLVSVLGNLLIILAIGSDTHLHTPMYFFFSHLSFNDICLNTTMIPKMLGNIQALNQHHIYRLSHPGWLFKVFVVFENCLLEAMAYDRYVAICHPLIYTVIMTPRPCVLLILLSLLLSVGDALLHCLVVLCLTFCTNRKVPCSFCELAQVINLACSDTFINNILIYFVTSLFGGVSVSGMIFSYTQMVSCFENAIT